MHKRMGISLDKEIIKKINQYKKDKLINFSQAIEVLITKGLEK